MKNVFNIVGLISITFWLSACFAPDTITLSNEQRALLIDSLAKQEIEKMIPIVEENCSDNFERYVAKAVDSLVTVHLDSTKYK